jgi:hypothetical protein
LLPEAGYASVGNTRKYDVGADKADKFNYYRAASLLPSLTCRNFSSLHKQVPYQVR